MNTNDPLRILLVEDNAGDARLVREALRDRGAGHWPVTHCASVEAVRQVLEWGAFDAALVDLGLPDAAGLEAVEAVLALDQRLTVLVLTGQEDEAAAAQALQAGAQDYLFKRLLGDLPLEHMVRGAVERQRLRRQAVRSLREVEKQQLQLAELLNGMPDGVLVVGAEGQNIRFSNPAAWKLLQATAEELLGQRFDCPLAAEGPSEIEVQREGGEMWGIELTSSPLRWHGQLATVVVLHDVTAQREATREREGLIQELQAALSQVKVLSGLLPICMHCKQIRDEQGNWQPIESYIHQRSEAEFSHSLCAACGREFYPDVFGTE